nr:MAG TPA: hypothetical protein [Caudoviricetes sp.]
MVKLLNLKKKSSGSSDRGTVTDPVVEPKVNEAESLFLGPTDHLT